MTGTETLLVKYRLSINKKIKSTLKHIHIKHHHHHQINLLNRKLNRSVNLDRLHIENQDIVAN